ncbi:hypothetical protein ACHAWT_001713 [Skeletonema menzelii]
MSPSSLPIPLTPVRKESTLNLTPPPPPSQTTKLVHIPSLPNLVDLSEEDYPNDNGRPIGFFLVPPPAIGSNVAAAADTAMPTRRCSRKRVAISPPSSPRRILYPRPLKKMKVLNFDKAIR